MIFSFLESISNYIEYFDLLTDSHYFLLVVNSLSLLLKICIFTILTLKAKTTFFSGKSSRKALLVVIYTILFTSIICDATWIIKLISLLIPDLFDYRIILMIIRLGWALCIIHTHALALFMENLINQHFSISRKHKLFFAFSGFFVLFFSLLSVLNFNCFQLSEASQFHFIAEDAATAYWIFILVLPAAISTLYKMHTNKLPILLKKQLTIFIWGLIIPYLISEFIQNNPFIGYYRAFMGHNNYATTYSYAFSGFSTLLLTFMLYFCAKKIMGFRFLNLTESVDIPTPHKTLFITTFKQTLDHLGRATSVNELHHITNNFFGELFKLKNESVKLYIREARIKEEKPSCTHTHSDKVSFMVESFIAKYPHSLDLFLQHKILMYHDIDFSNFYEQSDEQGLLLEFLDSIEAQALLPVFHNNKLTAYITISRDARNLYSSTEQNEMIAFAQYLGSIIDLLQNRNFDAILEHEHQLEKNLYQKTQELRQYREAIRSFLRTNSKHKEIGILFYRKRLFSFGNQIAKEMIRHNPNQHKGSPLSRALKKIALQAEEYKSPQTTIAKDSDGSTFVLSAVPHLEQEVVIITVSYPDPSDILKNKIDLLHDQTEWDYLLYLSTTKSGKLINELIPGNGEVLLNFKISLLKLALHKQALLLNAPDDDLAMIVNLIHHISMRSNLHTINVDQESLSANIGILLFGINPLFDSSKKYEKPLLEKYDKIGTIFINQVHLLDLDTQNRLAEFIRTGWFTILKTDMKKESDVRIICSTSQNLCLLTQEGLFSPALYKELHIATLSTPSLLTLSEHELSDLVDGFACQAVETSTISPLLILNDRDKGRLSSNRPATVLGLKKRIQQIILQKSKENAFPSDTEVVISGFLETDPDLIEAARLGKQALRDHKIMSMLWHRFNKNQNKMATFLGVNRSSINRRCKEFNLV